jgi:tetratricopeptide (TPR) repeat protein
MGKITRLSLLVVVMLLVACGSNKGARKPGESVSEAKGLLDLQQRAEMHYQQQDYGKALKLYRDLSEELPMDPEIWFRVGNCHYRLGQQPEAERAYREALIRNPGHSKSWYNLVYMQAEHLGRTVSEMYYSMDPSDPVGAKLKLMAAEVLEPFNINPETGKPYPERKSRDSRKDREDTLASGGGAPIKVNPDDIVMQVGGEKKKSASTRKKSPEKPEPESPEVKEQAAEKDADQKSADEKEKGLADTLLDSFRSLLD